MSSLLVPLVGAAAVGFAVAAYRSRVRAAQRGGGGAGGGAAGRNLANLSIRDARRGDVIIVAGAGEDLEDLSFTVDRVDHYRSGREEWAEVSGIAQNRRVFLEWYEDDVLEVLLYRGEPLGLGDLGVSEEDLARFDEEESRDNFVVYKGERYYYTGSQEVEHRRDDGPAASFYCWDFRAADGHVVSVEKWEGDPFTATFSEPIRPAAITVMRT